MASLKSPITGMLKWLDGLLRPLFNRLASETIISNGCQLIKQVERWSATYLTPATSFITMDVTDLYTMIPQEGGVQAIKRLIEATGLRQIDGVKKEIILALTRFVMTNNYFCLDGSYYKQIRGGAMGSPLTLTIANAYMYFVERPISKWANRTCQCTCSCCKGNGCMKKHQGVISLPTCSSTSCKNACKTRYPTQCGRSPGVLVATCTKTKKPHRSSLSKNIKPRLRRSSKTRLYRHRSKLRTSKKVIYRRPSKIRTSKKILFRRPSKHRSSKKHSYRRRPF
ncbi:unnamed protein product [Rotaria sp. Silwood1]|nr:unnamed protein product [Rotaria sp. Silwood1]